MLVVGQFAGLADSKADSVAGISVAAGLDGDCRLPRQPVKATWQEADALVAGEFDLIRKGKSGDWGDPIDPEAREKKTASFVGYYHIRLPAHLMGSDTLAGRLVREHERRAPTVHDLRKVRALNSEAGVSAPGGGSGAKVNDDTSDSYSAVGFMYKHRVLMNTLALAAAPDWASADWSVLLDYHEWVVVKLFKRKNGRTPSVDAVAEADRQMRAKWVEAVRSDGKSLTAAVQTCRTEWVSVFSELRGDRSGVDGDVQQPAAKKSRVALQRVESFGGEQICKFYNDGKCTYGKKCRYLHMCNVKGCGQSHPACEGHRGA